MQTGQGTRAKWCHPPLRAHARRPALPAVPRIIAGSNKSIRRWDPTGLKGRVRQRLAHIFDDLLPVFSQGPHRLFRRFFVGHEGINNQAWVLTYVRQGVRLARRRGCCHTLPMKRVLASHKPFEPVMLGMAKSFPAMLHLALCSFHSRQVPPVVRIAVPRALLVLAFNHIGPCSLSRLGAQWLVLIEISGTPSADGFSC